MLLFCNALVVALSKKAMAKSKGKLITIASRSDRKSNNIAVAIVGGVITLWGAIEKSPVELSQYWKNLQFCNLISYFKEKYL